MTYTHLSREERYQIHALRRQNITPPVIAAQLGRSRSSITRELKRNAGPQGYKPARAHDQARARQKARRNARQFDAQQWSQVHR